MHEKYPQGLKKNPIKIVSPNGSITKFNSYREAIDNTDNMGQAMANENWSPLGGQAEFAKADKQARVEGYDLPNAGMLEPVMNKLRNARESIEKRNVDFMAKTAAKKPAYNGQSTMSKLMNVKNPKKK